MGPEKVTRIVIDTNVLISALLFGGAPGELIELWKKRRIAPLISEEIMSEYLRVMAYPKFQLSEGEINYILHREILPYFEVVEAKTGPTIIPQDPEDDKFIRCADAGNAATIISGDRHLLALEFYRGIKIFSIAQFLKSVTNPS